MATDSITIEQWITASTDQRHDWLLNNVSLDPRGQQIISWYSLFREAGAIMDSDVMLKVYRISQERLTDCMKEH